MQLPIQPTNKEDNSENKPWQPTPFRTTPYVKDEQELEETGLSVTIDDRTFNVLVKGAAERVANGWQDVVNGAADFVQNSLKKTFNPNKKPLELEDLDLFKFLPTKNEPSSSYGSPDPTPVYAPTPTIPPAVTSTITSSYGAPQAPVSSYGSPQAPVSSYGSPQVPISSYGAPKAPTVSNYGVAPKRDSTTNSYGTNFQGKYYYSRISIRMGRTYLFIHLI